MLSEITIENVAVIEKATAHFDRGFTVLTGETGAGKSILIDSVNAIMGNRTSKEIVRNNAQSARIWACFEAVPSDVERLLEDAGYTVEDTLLLQREIAKEGKSSSRINGMPATAGVLQQVCGSLVNIHGQYDNQSLLNPAKHMGILNAFAKNSELLEQYQKEYDLLTSLRAEKKSLCMGEEEKNRRLELLRYEVDEIEKAELYEGEEEELSERRNILQNARHITDMLNSTYLALSGTDDMQGAVSLLGEASGSLADAAGFAKEYREYADKLDEYYYNLQEISSFVQSKVSSFEYDEEQADELEERLDVLYRLKQKYGRTIEKVMEYGEKAKAELGKIEFSSQRVLELEEEEKQAALRTGALAKKLTEGRKNAFETLRKAIANALEFLNMPGIQMSLRHSTVDFKRDGADECELLISTNIGEEPKPLAKIASGGEMARIMLAIKSALADRDEMPTVIYDEIDTGVSGIAAARIGQLLRDTAENRQVICVTHTAQIAAYARRHLLIEKKVKDGRAYTSIRELQGEERVDELARIMSGDTLTDAARENARAMLKAAGDKKSNALGVLE